MIKVSKKTNTIVIPVFNVRFTLIDSKKKYKFIKKHNDGIKLPDYKMYPGYIHTAEWDGYLYYVVSLRDKDIQTIVHEATHMAHYAMKHNGIPINYKNTETQAYLIEYIVGKLCEETVKRK